ncbi:MULTISPECIES: type II toxin-antitoxin system HicB family antitoxin [unclassified Moraxella]|uniref:type II toxin-antitoxin system HicB family antitoxin n=1 Tax=unclassified Moraxella TaxID=2685852 RepID=UPI002B416F7B|nr:MULTISPECIES: type II toxin-antitoxin system HicB family antitoxin [unclassified Moraxella]
MYYPVTLTPDTDGFCVTFRDIPEAISQGDTIDEALEMAKDALAVAMEFYFEDNRAVPMPSTAQDGEHLVGLPPSVWAKVLLLNEMLAQNVSQAELAKRMGIVPQKVTRLVDLSHTTKIDTLAQAFDKLGKHLQVGLA